MKTKAIIRNILLFVVVGSVVYMAGKEILEQRNARGGAPAGAQAIDPTTKVIVYYFSQGKECATCVRIESFTEEALSTYFKDEIASRAIVLRKFDVDEAQNEHFISKYGIYTKSVVIARVEDGQEVAAKNLEEVWDLVYDQAAFVEYIRAQVREALDATT